jgi:hypothetical protein
MVVRKPKYKMAVNLRWDIAQSGRVQIETLFARGREFPNETLSNETHTDMLTAI